MSKIDDMSPEEMKQFIADLRIELATREFSHFVKEAWQYTDTQPLIWNWHIQIICDLLQKVSEGKIKKLIINIPPGFGKSKLCAVLYPAWDWIQDPSRYMIYATYAANLSNKFAKAHRDLVKSDWYQQHWGMGTKHNIVIDGDSTQRKQEFENNHLGGRFSTGKGGEVTGRRANIILFDDLNKSQDATGKSGIIGSEIAKGVEFLAETLWTRRILTNTQKNKTAFVGICQRLHHADVAQWCIDQEAEDGTKEFVHLNLPMECIEEENCIIVELPDGSFRSALGWEEAEPLITKLGGKIWWQDPRKEGELLFPQLVNRQEVEDMKQSLGPINASAQLQQKPTPAEGAKINIDWFKEYDLFELKEKLFSGQGESLISVDTSFGGKDWVVAQLWRTYKTPHPADPMAYYLVDQARLRTGIKGTIDAILQLHQKWEGPKKVLIEEAANGKAAIELLKEQIKAPGLLVQGYKPNINKEARVDHCSPIIQEGKVFLPKDANFNIASLKEELRIFPLGNHDDQVDSLSMALIYFMQKYMKSHDAKIRAISKYYRS